MGIPDRLPASWETCMQLKKQQLERNMERWTGSKLWNGVSQGCILSPCLFNFCAEYIMQNARLEDAQAGIKTGERNINNLSYVDDTTLMAESEEELNKKPLDEGEGAEWKNRLKTKY